MKIHTIGDSHCYCGWENISNVITHHLGPKLCHSFGNSELDISKFGINKNDVVIFCFGEIDCRCHVFKHITENKSYKNIIDELTDKYLSSIKNCMKEINAKITSVFNVVPPVNKFNTPENQDYPYLGKDEERKSYVLYFNEKLKEKCKEYGYNFFDVYNHYSDDDGFLRKEFSDGNVHIKNGIFLQNFIEKNFSIESYSFTNDWFKNAENDFNKFLLHLNEKKCKILEIGSHEGRSTVWLIDNLLSSSESTLISIDPYFESDPTSPVKENTYDIFMKNISLSKYSNKFKHFKDVSRNIIPTFEKNIFDLIYVDGSHLAEDVYYDSFNSWELVKINGILWFDDYGCTEVKKILDKFMEINYGKFKVFVKGWQLAMIRLM